MFPLRSLALVVGCRLSSYVRRLWNGGYVQYVCRLRWRSPAAAARSSVARACCSGDGIVNLTNDAKLDQSTARTHKSDNAITASLHIGPLASVSSPTSYWRLGNYGANIDAGLQGDGLLDVQGCFSANVIFLGDQDSHGELRVSGHGSVTLNAALQPNVGDQFPESFGNRPNDRLDCFAPRQ